MLFSNRGLTKKLLMLFCGYFCISKCILNNILCLYPPQAFRVADSLTFRDVYKTPLVNTSAIVHAVDLSCIIQIPLQNHIYSNILEGVESQLSVPFKNLLLSLDHLAEIKCT